jgi:hypothetical protein
MVIVPIVVLATLNVAAQILLILILPISGASPAARFCLRGSLDLAEIFTVCRHFPRSPAADTIQDLRVR